MVLRVRKLVMRIVQIWCTKYKFERWMFLHCIICDAMWGIFRTPGRQWCHHCRCRPQNQIGIENLKLQNDDNSNVPSFYLFFIFLKTIAAFKTFFLQLPWKFARPRPGGIWLGPGWPWRHRCLVTICIKKSKSLNDRSKQNFNF